MIAGHVAQQFAAGATALTGGGLSSNVGRQEELVKKYPEVLDKEMVGTYPSLAGAGGGYVWDEVLEYRVWCHPDDGAVDHFDGSDYHYAFDNYEMALEFSINTPGAEEPIALVLQREYIEEPRRGKYIHMKEERITEWPVEFLDRPRRTETTLPDFFSPDAPKNRVDIIRGLAKSRKSK